MDLRELKRIIRLVETSNIEELEIEQEGSRIRVRKGSPITQTYLADRFLPAPSSYQVEPFRTQPPGGGEEPPLAHLTPLRPETVVPETGPTINSPMVGTFYRSPSPDAPVFVQIGSQVEPDTVVCILEAMKVMNEIKAGCAGRITEVMVENAAPVEFGQPLFRLAAG